MPRKGRSNLSTKYNAHNTCLSRDIYRDEKDTKFSGVPNLDLIRIILMDTGPSLYIQRTLGVTILAADIGQYSCEKLIVNH